MTLHNRVVQTVKEYFETLPLGMNKAIDTEEPIQFGANVGGFADVVLRANSRYVAIAECKNPWDSKESAKAQLKSYLCATGTLFGILAIGRATENWIFVKIEVVTTLKKLPKKRLRLKFPSGHRRTVLRIGKTLPVNGKIQHAKYKNQSASGNTLLVV